MRASSFIGLLIVFFGLGLIIIGMRRRVQVFKQAVISLTGAK